MPTEERTSQFKDRVKYKPTGAAGSSAPSASEVNTDTTVKFNSFLYPSLVDPPSLPSLSLPSSLPLPPPRASKPSFQYKPRGVASSSALSAPSAPSTTEPMFDPNLYPSLFAEPSPEYTRPGQRKFNPRVHRDTGKSVMSSNRPETSLYKAGGKRKSRRKSTRKSRRKSRRQFRRTKPPKRKTRKH